MADDIDIMQDVEQRLLDERIKAQTAAPAVVPMDNDCDECGCEIDAARRAVLPYTTLCIDCASLKERKR